MPLIYAGKRLKVRKMSQLKSLLEAVKDHKLSKEQLEDFHAELTQLFALMHLEMASLEKEEAIYLAGNTEDTAIAVTRAWNAGEKGQRMIELKHFLRASEKMLSSLKNRIYSLL